MNLQVKLIKNDSPAWTKIFYRLAILDIGTKRACSAFLITKKKIKETNVEYKSLMDSVKNYEI